MEKSIFQVNLSGILRVLSDSLYSSKDVFIRELIQNSVDAIRFRLLQENVLPAISVQFFDEGDARGLIFSDNGIGLTFDQANEFLSRIGSSSKADLIENRNDFIGQFGIGLLSCFMVSDEITVISKSLTSNQTIKWTGFIDGTYKTEIVDHTTETGTTIILKIRESVSFDFEKLLGLLNLYGKFIGYPINVERNGKPYDTILGQFCWETNTNDAIVAQGVSFFEQHFNNYFVFETEDKCNRGIVYILPHTVHAGAAQESRVYIKNMFITNKANNILPEWAFFVRAVINSDTLSPTASREEIYVNETLTEVKDALGKAVRNYLVSLSQQNPEALHTIIAHHNVALKSLCITDKKFLRFVFKWFAFETVHGDLRLEEIRNKSKKILYIDSVDGYRQLLPIATASGIMLINAGYIYNAELLRLIGKFDKEFVYQEITVEYFGNILEDLGIDEYNDYEDRIDQLQYVLKEYKCLVEVKRFQPDSIPALFYMDKEQAVGKDIENIKEESDDFWSSITETVFAAQEFDSKLYLNLNNPIVLKLLSGINPENEKLILEMLYVNAMMMGHYPVSNRELNMLNHNTIALINKL